MEQRTDSGRLVWGIVLLAVGLIFLLNNFGWWFGWGRWWPLILIALGLWMMYRREGPGQPAPTSLADMPAPPATADAPTAPPSSTRSTPPAEVVTRRRYPAGGIILVGVGVAFLLGDVIGGSAFPAIVLIAIGVALLLRERRAP